MPRQARLDAIGILQHVIVRGIEQRSIFSDQRDRKNFITRMGELALETDTKIYAWSLMPNHVHILLRTGPSGLAKYMRRLLTGYAVSFNHRHLRHGYLFQNRYKSIICNEDAYFQELVRYIHLNPLRANLVKNIADLERYRWCGHGALFGYVKYPWQDCDYVLSWFGSRKGDARKAYRRYMSEGISQGRRPELVGEGLKGFLKNWGQELEANGKEDNQTLDSRILGVGDFVRNVLERFGQREEGRSSSKELYEKMEGIIKERCREGNINIEELRKGSRRNRVAQIRSDIAWQLASELGFPLAEIGRQLGVSTSAISKILRGRERSEI